MASNEITGCQGFPTLQYTESFRTCEQFKEGQGYTKRAERALSTSFFSLKFSPDWDVAAAEYGRAAQCFQTGAQRICPVDPGALQHAAATHLKVAAIRERQHDSFGAGRAREQVGVDHLDSKHNQIPCRTQEIVRTSTVFKPLRLLCPPLRFAAACSSLPTHYNCSGRTSTRGRGEESRA
eukprot:GHVT01090406.1.p1 GENE.GHVT01090406.1~~GHVT01090406.1.p1  ORF type:complete len:180 (+),score=10.90 GHVT01090406.1:611-1150(+)